MTDTPNPSIFILHPVLIPSLILSFLSLLTLALSLRGRRIDTHPTCRRCKFDLINLPSTTCPECGANLEAPKAIRTGNRQRLRRLAIFSCFLLVIGVAGSGLSIYGTTRKIDWYTYKPVWWLRLDAKYGSQESVTHATNELLARNDNNKLSTSDLETVITTLAGALESGHLSTPTIYGHTLAELISSTRLSQKSHDFLTNWILSLQQDRTKPWSTELGSAFLNECLSKRIPQELMDRFLKQTCAPQLTTALKRQLRPGEKTLLVVTLNPRGGGSFANITLPPNLAGPVPGTRQLVVLPSPGIAIGGMITAPSEPGTYTVEGTVTALLSPDDPSTSRRRPNSQPPATPQTPIEWPLKLTYQVSDSTPAEPLKDFAERLFWVGDLEPNRPGRAPSHTVTLYATPAAPTMSVEFDVLWRYQGNETSVGSGSLDITPRSFSSSMRTQSSSGSSSGGSSSGMKARPERYMLYIPNTTGPAITGTIIIHITKLTFDGAPSEPVTPFDLEFPNTNVHW